MVTITEVPQNTSDSIYPSRSNFETNFLLLKTSANTLYKERRWSEALNAYEQSLAYINEYSDELKSEGLLKTPEQISQLEDDLAAKVEDFNIAEKELSTFEQRVLQKKAAEEYEKKRIAALPQFVAEAFAVVHGNISACYFAEV